MKKAQTLEMLDISALIIAISVMLIISYFLLTSSVPVIKRLGVEEHIYTRTADVVNALYNAKIAGTKRTLVQLLVDRIEIGDKNVMYGEGVGVIDVDEQTTKFLDTYLSDRWNLTIISGSEFRIAFLVDTSLSVTDDDLPNILDKVPSIARRLREKNKLVSLNLYLLPPADCTRFRMENISCMALSRSICDLVHETQEDWGNGVACLAKYHNPDIILVISDELSTSSNCESDSCCQTGVVKTKSTASVENGKIECQRKFIEVFTLQADYSSCEDCPQWGYCRYCDPCIEKLEDQMRHLSGLTGGKYYRLSKETNAGEVAENIIMNQPIETKITLGHEIPQDIKRKISYLINLPLPSPTNEVAKLYLYTW